MEFKEKLLIFLTGILFALFDTPLFYAGVWLLKPHEKTWGYHSFAEEAL